MEPTTIIPTRIPRKRRYPVQICLPVKPEMNKSLIKLATNKECSIQDVIREFIDLGLEQKEGKN